MTRQECERRIADKLLEILDIVKEYNPDENHGLSMYIRGNSYHAFRIIEHASPDDPEPPVYDILISGEKGGQA